MAPAMSAEYRLNAPVTAAATAVPLAMVKAFVPVAGAEVVPRSKLPTGVIRILSVSFVANNVAVFSLFQIKKVSSEYRPNKTPSFVVVPVSVFVKYR